MTRFAIVVLLAGCGGKGADGEGDGAEESCDTCADDGQLCVVYADGDDFDDWRETCAPNPGECASDPECSTNECAAAMYDLCEDGYFGQARSCSGQYLSVTCTPDSY